MVSTTTMCGCGTATSRRSTILPWISLMILLISNIIPHHHNNFQSTRFVTVVDGQPSTSSTIPPTTATTYDPNLNRNWDRFNYVATVQDATHIDFGPEDWANVQCPDLATCVRSTCVCVRAFCLCVCVCVLPLVRWMISYHSWRH